MRVTTLPGEFAFLRPIAFDATVEGRRWQLAAEAGVWFNQRHGEITISLDDIASMHETFQSRMYPQGAQELPIDYEHLSVKADRKPGDGVAAGWIHDTQIRSEGRELWALVEWTDAAREKIKKKEYKGFSPLFAPKWKAHGGKELGATLLGGALTNYQTIPNCVVTCSNDATLGGDARLLASFGDLSFSERENRVREAFNLQFPPKYKADGSLDWESYRYFQSADDDVAIFTQGSKRYAIAYEVDSDLSVKFTGSEYEIILTATPIAASNHEGPTMKVKTADGKEVEVSTDFLKTLTLDALSEIPAVKTMREKADTAGDASALKSTVDTLSASVTALSNQLETQKTQLATETAARTAAEAKLLDQELAQLQAQGRLLPAEVEPFKKLALENRPVFDALVAARKTAAPLVNTTGNPVGIDGQPGAAGGPILEFDQLIDAVRKENPKLTYADAIIAAQDKNPGLARRRLEAMQASGVIAMSSMPTGVTEI